MCKPDEFSHYHPTLWMDLEVCLDSIFQEDLNRSSHESRNHSNEWKMLSSLTSRGPRLRLIIDDKPVVPYDLTEASVSSERSMKTWDTASPNEILDDPARFSIVEAVQNQILSTQNDGDIILRYTVRILLESDFEEHVHGLSQGNNFGLTDSRATVELRRGVLLLHPIEVDDSDLSRQASDEKRDMRPKSSDSSNYDFLHIFPLYDAAIPIDKNEPTVIYVGS